MDVLRDVGYTVADYLSSYLNMVLCVMITLAGLWQMNVFRIELLP